MKNFPYIRCNTIVVAVLGGPHVLVINSLASSTKTFCEFFFTKLDDYYATIDKTVTFVSFFALSVLHILVMNVLHRN